MADGVQPFGQRFAVALETTKFSSLDYGRAVGLFHDGAGADLSLMHVQHYHALVDGGSSIDWLQSNV
jgi:hypothetical protein